MTGEELDMIRTETAVAYEMYGFEMPFTMFQDIFEFGAAFGLSLAQSKNEHAVTLNTSVVQSFTPLQFLTKHLQLSASTAK